MAAADGSHAFVLASLVPVRAALPFGGYVQVEGAYPFGDAVQVRVVLPALLRATAFVRIPGWADEASIDGKPAPNGTLVAVPCVGTSTLLVALNPNSFPEYLFRNLFGNKIQKALVPYRLFETITRPH